MKKLLQQRLAQLSDKFPNRREIRDDYLELKFNDEDKFYLSLVNKYKDEI
jgi:hypothetical protein